jgi:hypothetical protein
MNHSDVILLESAFSVSLGGIAETEKQFIFMSRNLFVNAVKI